MGLVLKNVSKTFVGKRAVDNISFELNKPGVFGLLGTNGAGKTTTIRMLLGIIKKDSGEITWNGKVVDRKSVNFGYLPEERGLYKSMKVGEQCLYLAQMKGLSKAEAKKQLEYWFDKLDIKGWWNKKIEELSKGMAQKIQFVVTVLHQPKLLIFDEPFSGFDPVNANLIKDEILELREKGATIIFSTHNMVTVEDLCENISLVNKSRIVLQGNVAEIRASHKTDTFSLQSATQIVPDGFELIEQLKKNNVYECIIKKSHADTNNELLAKLIKQAEIVSFQEILPSMNDIFIETVSGSSVGE